VRVGEATLIEWRGPAPVVAFDHHYGEIAHAARQASYGWGVVPVAAVIGTTRFTTSLFRATAVICCR
jgi:hypothetical protein